VGWNGVNGLRAMVAAATVAAAVAVAVFVSTECCLASAFFNIL
jgi:hypothetical protein